MDEKAMVETKRGKKELRVLISKGKFVKYGYMDMNGEMLKKYSIILFDEDGNGEHYIIVPIKKGELVVKHERDDEERWIWDKKRKKSFRFP